MDLNNKYIVFMGDDFYPSGGWLDYSASFDTLEAAIQHIENSDPCSAWAHIMHKGNIIAKATGEDKDYENVWVWEDEMD